MADCQKNLTSNADFIGNQAWMNEPKKKTYGQQGVVEGNDSYMDSQSSYLTPRYDPGYIRSVLQAEQEAYFNKVSIDLQAENIRNVQKLQYQYELELMKYKIREEYEERKEQRILDISISENGRIYIDKINPDGSKIRRLAVSNVRSIRSVLYKAEGVQDEYIEISWEEAGKQEKLLVPSKIKEKELAEKLAVKGFRLDCDGRNKKIIFSKLKVWFLRNAKIKILPFSHGWNKQEGRWHFVRSDEPVFEEVVRDDC